MQPLQLTFQEIMAFHCEDAKPVLVEKRLPGIAATSFDTMAESDITPLKSLARWPRHIRCPGCRQLSVTRVRRKISSGTQYVFFTCTSIVVNILLIESSFMAGLFFLCSVLGSVYPYFSKTYKDVEHSCCRCGCKLATYHVMSGTEIHVF